MNAIDEFLTTHLAPRLRSLLGPLDAWLVDLPPGVWRASVMGLFAFGIAIAFCFRHDYIYRGAPDRALWRDLRLWAALFMIPYVLIYLFF